VRIEGIGKPGGCKLIRISAEADRGVLRSVLIRGDFFASPEEGFERVEARLSGAALDELGPAFDRLLAEEGVEAQGINGEGLAEVFRSALPVQNPSERPAGLSEDLSE
jgi:hypothetical protein